MADDARSELLADALRQISEIVNVSESDPDIMFRMVGEIERIANNARIESQRA